MISVTTDLDTDVDFILNFESHIDKISTKARQRAALILKCFRSRYRSLLIQDFIIYVQAYLRVFIMCLASI